MYACFRAASGRAWSRSSPLCNFQSSLTSLRAEPSICQSRQLRKTWLDARFYHESEPAAGSDTEFRPPIYEHTVSPPPRDPESWLAVIDRLLPYHLRRSRTRGSRNAITTENLPAVMRQSLQYAKIEILNYLGVHEGRWQALVWLVKDLVEGINTTKPTIREALANSSISLLPKSSKLDDIASAPIYLDRSSLRDQEFLTLDSVVGDTSPYNRGVIGDIWRNLGFMILTAADQSSAKYDAIIPGVLEIIAYLHSKNLVPEAVYRFEPISDPSALQPPPHLHVLSSRILTALSDAAWRAQQAMTNEVPAPKYFYSFFKLGALHKSKLPRIGPEIWLELVLWACVHSGFVLDAVAILKELVKRTDNDRWGLISWRQTLQSLSGEESSSASSLNWQRWSLVEDPARIVERTISCEVVSACIDGLVTNTWVGVGAKGIPPQTVVGDIEELRDRLLNRRIGPDGSSWDAVILRLMESPGINVKKDLAFAQQILYLTPSFSAVFSDDPDKISATSSLPLDCTEDHDSSAMVLGLFHRLLMDYVDARDVVGVARTINRLSRYTHVNQKRSLELFFSKMKSYMSDPESVDDSEPSNMFSGIGFPGIYPHIPPNALAATIELLTTAREYDFIRWLLDPQEVGNSIVAPIMYGHPHVATALIGFASAIRDKELLTKVLAKRAQRTHNFGNLLPKEILSALLKSQIEARQWDSVTNTLKTAWVYRLSNWTVAIAASLAREAFRTAVFLPLSDAKVIKDSSATPLKMFRHFVKGGYGKPARRALGDIDALVCIMSSVNRGWAQVCLPLRTRSGKPRLELRTADFNTLLDGIVEAHGSGEGKRLWELWCDTPDPWRTPGQLTGGVSKLPREKISRAYSQRLPREVTIETGIGEPIKYAGGIIPTLDTLRILVRKARQERTLEKHGEAGEPIMSNSSASDQQGFVTWAIGILEQIGLSNAEIRYELRDMGELPISSFPPPNEMELDDEDEYNVWESSPLHSTPSL